MRRHAGEEVKPLARAVGEDELALDRVDRGERSADLECDPSVGEEP